LLAAEILKARVFVAPAMVARGHDRGRPRRDLGLLRERVGIQRQLAVRREDLVLVSRARLGGGQKQLPDARRAERAHRVQPTVPAVEIAYDAYCAGGWSPDRERRSRHALVLADVGAELVVELLVASLCDQVQVELAERGRE